MANSAVEANFLNFDSGVKMRLGFTTSIPECEQIQHFSPIVSHLSQNFYIC